MNNRNLRLRAVSYCRNGVFGHGFYTVLFRELRDRSWHNMVATVFEVADVEAGEPEPCTGELAVLDLELLQQAIVDKPNHWRGDHYEPQLRQWIARYELERAEAQRKAFAERPGEIPPG